MKKKIYSMALLAALTAITACNDIDLDAPMDEYTTEAQKIEAKEANPDRAQAAITGITSVFSSYMTVVDRHVDFGYPSLMLGYDGRGVDVVGLNTGYNWFAGFNELSDCSTTAYGTQMAWGHLYKQIFAANAALKSIDGATEEPLLQFYLAQAYAIRAFDYFMLAQIYQFPYSTSRDKLCVMLITEENEDEVSANGALRSTVEQIYTQITSDLDKAVELIEASNISPAQVIDSKAKRFLSRAAIYGLRAKVDLVKEDWAAAVADATVAITASGATPLSPEEASVPGFASIDDANWMWGIAIAPTDRVVTSGIVNWPSFMGSLNDGYATAGAWRMVNRALYDAIPASDVRKGWWLDGESHSAALTEQQQAYVDAKSMPPYTQVKFAPYQDIVGQSENANDIPLMRVEEMYLVLAEAQAMNGNPAQGAQTLSEFVSTYRDPDYDFSSGDAKAVQNEVLQQRRIELWGEGITYFDFMRMGKEFDRRGGGWEPEWCYNIQPNDPVLIVPIPNSEVQGNQTFRLSNTNNSASPQPTAVKDVEYESNNQ